MIGLKAVLYVQITRNKAECSLGVGILGQLKIDFRIVFMFVAKMGIVCSTVPCLNCYSNYGKTSLG